MYSRTIACDQKNKALKINLMPCSIYSGERALKGGSEVPFLYKVLITTRVIVLYQDCTHPKMRYVPQMGFSSPVAAKPPAVTLPTSSFHSTVVLSTN